MKQDNTSNLGPRDEDDDVVHYTIGGLENSDNIDTQLSLRECSRSQRKIKTKDSKLRQLAILACGFYCQFCGVGASYGSGIIYAELVSRYPEAPRELLAFVFTLSMGLTYLGGSLSTTVINRVGSRWTLVIATLLATFGSSISFLATGVEFLFISYGFILGLGCGLINVTSMVAIKEYFGENAKLAMSVVSIGSGLGILVFQQISAAAINAFGWQGTMLIFAGMTFNVMIPAFIIPSVSKQQQSQKHDTPSMWKIPPILKYASFDLWLIFVFAIAICIPMMAVIFPDYVAVKGFSSDEAVTFLSLNTFMGFPGRIILILVMKCCNFIPTSVLIFLTGLIIAVPLMVLSYTDTAAVVLSLALISGTGFGFWIILLWIGTLDISGSELYASAQSIVTFTYGVGTFLGGPFAGFVLEQTGTYDVAYQATAGGLLCASSLYLLVPVINYFKQRRSGYERL